MKIPFGDLRRQYFSIKEEIDSAIQQVLNSGWFILGKNVEAFEREFASYCGAKYGVGVGSGTEALHLALLACGIGKDDEVITVANTSIATVSAIRSANATPLFVDIDEQTCLMDISKIEKAITPKTKAIIPVHLYGQPVCLEPILGIAKKHNLQIIEDCAQAHSAEYLNKKVGSIGTIGCFSFYPSKNLGAYGDGGLVITDNKRIAKRVKMLRFYGFSTRDYSEFEGINSRLDEIQAAILRIKLSHLDKWNNRRREIARLYCNLLKRSNVILPLENAASKHVYHLFVIRVKDRDALKNYLKEREISTGIHYPIPIHLQSAYKFLGYRRGDLPITERIANEILSLPIFPELTDAEVKYICKTIRSFG